MAGAKSIDPDGLTLKQRRFVEAYVGRANGNASAAARIAGYSDRSAGALAHATLKNVEVQAAISERYREAAMPADEVLARLAQQARNEASAFFEVEAGNPYAGGLNLDRLQEAGLMHLIKGLKPTANGLQVELLDPQAALVHIGRHQKLFTDKTEVTGKDGEPFELLVVRGVSTDDL